MDMIVTSYHFFFGEMEVLVKLSLYIPSTYLLTNIFLRIATYMQKKVKSSGAKGAHPEIVPSGTGETGPRCTRKKKTPNPSS